MRSTVGRDSAHVDAEHGLRVHAFCACIWIRVASRIRAEVDDMAMLRLIARDAGWLSVLPEVVVQDELRAGTLVAVGDSPDLQEHFYAITSPHRHRLDLLERLLPTATLRPNDAVAAPHADAATPATSPAGSAPPGTG